VVDRRPPCESPNGRDVTRLATFDYVVVGAGTAGCVLACRLAASGAGVALVEAGGRYRRVLDVPLLSLWTWLRRPARYSWQNVTEPQASLDGRRVVWPAGRLVGGSSAINAMIYCRGHRASYDRWQPTGGRSDAPVWDYDALLPYFRRSEDFEGEESAHHGTGGPIGVSASRHRTALVDAFLRGCDALGIPRTTDFNSGTAEGASYLHVTQRRGRRTSSARYLRAGLDLGRAAAFLGSAVRRIVFERGRATGVEIGPPDDRRVIHAAREVLLCAGAVRSPQLLMLSGVGPADALERLGIAVVADRPGVGENLQDHVRVPVAYECAGPRPTAPARLVRGAIRYALTGRGLFASNVADAAAIVRLDASRRVPDLRIVCRWRVLPEHPAWVVDLEVVAIDPASRGRVSLASADPVQPPRIDPGYLTDTVDAEVLRRGVDLARAIAATPACRAAGIGVEVLPGARDTVAHIRQHADTAFHPVGTCRLGGDDRAVVDAWLRVIGVSGLRVVDASVMPTTVAGNAQAAVFAIAERAADLVRAHA
jgi:choline dehydrogenase-like flavoprotein